MKKYINFIVINIIVNIIIIILPITKIDIPKTNYSNITMSLKEDSKTINIDENYNQSNVEIKDDNQNINKDVIVNSSELQNNLVGTYYVSYKVKLGEFREEEIYQKVEVVDNEKPKLYLKSGDTYYVTLSEKYVEPGFTALDNVDGDISQNVKVTGKVDYKKEGTYTLTYSVEDKSGNENSTNRTVIVTKGTKSETKAQEEEKNSISIKEMKYVDNNIKISGYIKNMNDDSELILKGNKEYNFKLNKTKKDYYEVIIDISDLKNDTYEVYIKNKKEEKPIIEIEEKQRLVRAHLNDKLVTMNYKKNNLSLKIEDFEYQYDILIDPGHGGNDVGASINGYNEKDANLKVSLYEKKRFEEHGLKVKMIREDDTYGIGMGDDSWHIVTRRANAIGYLGVVSKIVYSNHHNVISDTSRMGFEILVPSKLNYNDLKEEYEIYNKLKNIYPLKENHTRMYARDYEDSTIYDKENGQVYNFEDYYAVNRIPYDLYNVKAIIYENAYMSNVEDWNYYYIEENYKKISEQKIKVYVESLGLDYIPVE